MATYAIGDIQGCFKSLLKLLEKINYHKESDILLFTGDLVNRGPLSLETLRFVKSLGNRQQTVLGNHDLHLLAVANGMHKGQSDDTLLPILKAPDKNELLDWLQHQPLLYHDEHLGCVMIHAGLSPDWSLSTAKTLAKEAEDILQKDLLFFLNSLYGNHPDQWDPHLKNEERLRCIINFFTRVRFCYPDGRMEFKEKGKSTSKKDLIPWFAFPHRTSKDIKILFGHWAALEGKTEVKNIFALDTGCIWGKSLTAMRLEDAALFHVPCQDTV